MSAALERLRTLPGMRGAPERFTALCPAHEDRENSLSVGTGEGGRVLVKCFAGCTPEAIVQALGLRLADLQPPAPANGNGRPKAPPQFVQAYDYTDARGRLVFQVCRYSPKSFRQRQPDATKPGGWRWNLEGVERVLYKLPDVVRAAAAGARVFLTEGERDADAVAALGLHATTNAGGVAGWRREYADTLRGANVCVLADNDRPGIEGARRRAADIPGARVLLLPNLPEHGDVSDFLAAGGTAAELQRLADTAQEPEPEGEADAEPTPGDFPAWADMRGFWELAETEIPCVFDQALPRGELGVLASEPGLAKTTFAIGLGLSGALYKNVLHGFTPQRPGRVALLLGEDGKHPISKRLRAWAEARGVSRQEVETALADGRLKMVCGESAAFLAVQGGGLAETRAYAQFREMCEAEQFDLVVIDSLLEWTNVDNENDNATMHLAAKALINLAKASGGACLALCHTNKSGDRTGEAALHAIRGGGALAAKVRWAGLLLKLSDAEAKAYGIPEAERARYVSFREIKNQYHALRGAPSYFERAEGGVLEGVRLVPPTREEEFEELAGLLADNLGENPRGLPKWEVLTGPRGKVFRAELKLKCARATVENLKLAYELALKMGLIHEAEEGDLTGGATAKIPRKTGKAL